MKGPLKIKLDDYRINVSVEEITTLANAISSFNSEVRRSHWEDREEFVFKTKDREDAKSYMKAKDYEFFMDEFETWLRGQWKHADLSKKNCDEFVDEVWQQWHDFKNSYGIVDA